ncbi:MAG TPA: hypothetical protein VLM75_06055 [Spirochaetota bacterium]|nr:hypothetical protein [Spirochaetota bacterium]
MFTMAMVCPFNVALSFALVFHTTLGYRGIALSAVFSNIVGAFLESFQPKKWFTGASGRSFAIIKQPSLLGPSAIRWSMNASIFVRAVLISVRYFRKDWLIDAKRKT